MFGVKKHDKEERTIAKNVNFGTFFGLFPNGLQRTLKFKAGLDVTLERCEKIIANIKAGYPALTSWQRDTINRAAARQYSETWLGRRRYLPGITSKDWSKRSFSERCSLNTSIQGTDRKKLNHSMLRKIIVIIRETFEGLTDTSSPVEVIASFNSKLDADEYKDLKTSLLGESFYVSVFDEYDISNNKPFVSNLSALTWATSFKLFTEVFSPESKYMTVHQAKGLEWDKVIVSVNPNNFDKIKLPAVYSNPEILKEEAADEFVRMYYVACNRSRESLYIHLPSGFDQNAINTALNGRNVQYKIIT